VGALTGFAKGEAGPIVETAGARARGDRVALRTALLIAAAAAALAACGRPDASGLYLSRSDRAVTLVQLGQTRDGAVRGRIEAVSIGPGGQIDDRSTALDGTAAQHGLTFRSAGAAVSGTFSHDALALNGPGLALTARRSSLKDYQAAVARLESAAAAERKRASDAEARQADAAVQTEAVAAAPDKAARIEAATAELLDDAAKLNAGVADAPDFGQQAAQVTAQIVQLAQRAPRLSGADRRQAIASANQLVLGASQIEVARSQYAVRLNQAVRRGAPLATEVLRFCGSAPAATLAGPCAKASAAATQYQSALVHAVVVFGGYKRAIQLDLARQNELVRKIGG
jgi:hypothetical protein